MPGSDTELAADDLVPHPLSEVDNNLNKNASS